MHIYKNGERCPCCGEQLQSMTGRELELFSELCAAAGMEPLSGLQLIAPPPDAGINPPVTPVFDA